MKRTSAPVWLPALRVTNNRGVPLSDTVTAAICAAVLAGTRVAAGSLASRLAALAERDPSLAVWWFEQGGEVPEVLRSQAPPDRVVDDLGWLERLADSLTTIPVKQKFPRKWAQQSLCAVATARQARCRAARRLPGAEAVAYWGGLLSGAVDCALHGTSCPRRLSARRIPSDWLDQRLVAARCESGRQTLIACIRRASRAVADDPRRALRRWISPRERSAGMLQSVPFRAVLPRLLQLLVEHRRLQRDCEHRLESEKLQAMRELAYGASHEINNPLANIASRAQILLRDEPDAERRRSLATINSQVFRAHEMLADLMLFAKPPPLECRTLDLVQLVRQVVLRLEEERPPEVVCRWETSEPALVVEADDVQLAVALAAIGRNGIQAMQRGGLLRFELRPVPSTSAGPSATAWAEVVIQDTGPGLSDHQRRHLFDPFFSGREAGRGLGLGLSKAWRIIQLHGGQIRVDSQLGIGTSFTVRLPASAGAGASATLRPNAAPSARESEPARGESSEAQPLHQTDPPGTAGSAPPATPGRSPPQSPERY
jgi:signal transduction histidine kinase